ncbi:2-hydroxyisoflavanone dehydratase-like [Cicer arietinum]|uniref:2-hydroxyisoflavanone dehydratase-like n=1 Tax=Cicer arietinum TaxID=3827 RepID=A0A1S2Z2B7_CICAR|nr:2-hydroxyisoflavanone dehydratase-like [Cicer arietinum]XP_004513745.1 2-hydroxyisoflavanone dehydratase-like [Cicer arietinum]
MDPNSNEIVREFPNLFRLYKDGRVERLLGIETTPAGTDPLTGVQSKDITINSETGLAARLYLPPNATTTQKLPLLVYIHGGAFCVCSPYNTGYHHHLNTVSAQANIVVFSIHYRLAPEHPLPVAYDDTWEAIQWISKATDPWLADHADLNIVFFAGDSAGGNLSHNMAMRGATEGFGSLKLQGIVLLHPFFGNEEKDELLEFLYPSYGGLNDPKIHAANDPNLSSLGCGKVLVFVAGKDFLRERGRTYYDALKKSGWSGAVEMVETEGEGHVFHLFDPTKEKSVALVQQFISFITQTAKDVNSASS